MAQGLLAPTTASRRLGLALLAALFLSWAAAQPADDRSMSGVAVVSEGARVSLRWYLPGEVFPDGGFVVTRTGPDGASATWHVPSPLPPERSLVDPQAYEAAVTIFDPSAPPVDDDPGFALARAVFTLRAAMDPDLAATLGILLHDDDVAVGERLRYEVRTAGGALVGEASATVGSTPALPAPTGLQGTVENGAVGLVWDRPDEQDLLVAYRAEVVGPSGAAAPLGDDWAPLPTPEDAEEEGAPFWILDEGRLPGETVTYRVVGRDLFGRTTPPSEPVTVTVPIARALPLPQVTGADVGDRAITLRWAISPDPDVSGFMVLRATELDAEPEPVSPLLPASESSWHDAGLAGGTDYYYYVAVFAEDGSGVVGPAWAQRAVNPNPPGAPSALTVDAREGSLVVSWRSPADEDVGRYQVYAARPGTPFDAMTLVGETRDTTLEVPVPANTLFDVAFRVRAVNTSDVSGPPSSAAAGRVVDLTPPSAPLWVSASGAEGSVSLTWARDLDPDVAYIRVLRSPAGEGAFEVVADELAPAVTTFEDGGAVPGVAYDYALQAVDAEGNWSELSEARTAAPWSLAAPAAVAGLTAELQEDGGVRLAWEAGEPGTRWVVARRLNGGWVEVSDLLSEPAFVDARGQAGDAYRVVSVSSTQQVGEGVTVEVAAP